MISSKLLPRKGFGATVLLVILERWAKVLVSWMKRSLVKPPTILLVIAHRNPFEVLISHKCLDFSLVFAKSQHILCPAKGLKAVVGLSLRSNKDIKSIIDVFF